MASSESVPGAKRRVPDHRKIPGVCGLLNPVDIQEESSGVNSDRRYGSKHSDDRPNNLDLNNWRPSLSSENRRQVKKRNQERELEKRGNTNWRLESTLDDRNEMQDHDSSRRQAAGAVGGANTANRKTDCNYLVTRLMKLRACLSQASKASEKYSKRVDANGVKQFARLSSVVRQLKEEEDFCLSTLQRLLVFRNSESQSHQSSGHRFEEPDESDGENNEQEQEQEQEPEREPDVNSSFSDNELVDDAEKMCSEVPSFMSQKHESFYRLLQEQQTSLLSSQEELSRAEGDLKSCTSWDEGMRRYKPTFRSLHPGLLTRPSLSCRSLDGPYVQDEDFGGSTKVKPKYVRNVCKSKEEASSDRVNSRNRCDHLVVEHLGPQEQRRLEEKLRGLDEKKRNMNEMLQKLQSLRMERSFLNNELASVAAAKVRDLGCGKSGKISSSQLASGVIEEAAWSKERQSNHRKLEMSSECSDGMQGQNEMGEEFLSDREDLGSFGTSSGATFDPMVIEDGWTALLNSQYNINSHESVASVTSGNPGNGLNCNGELDVKASPGRGRGERRQEEQNLEDERCAALQETLRQLKGTKETLNNLKQLVVLVHQSPDSATCMADGLPRFPKDVVPVTTTCCLEEEDRGEDVVGKYRRQQAELAELMEEHRCLLELQEELERIQETLPKVPADAEEASAGEVAMASQMLNEEVQVRDSTKHLPLPITNSAAKMTSEPVQVKFQDPIETVVSNEELYGRMRQQRMLREELLEKKKELQQMMQKDKSLKQNSRNQMTHSDSVSYSNRSDQCRASPSEDITTATWGGSTAGNLESIGETENRSGREEDNDENDDKDDEGKSGESFAKNRMAQVEEEERYEDRYAGDARVLDFEDADGTNDATRSHITKYSSMPNAFFRPLMSSVDANFQRDVVASGNDVDRSDGTYCISNDGDTSGTVHPIINSLSVPVLQPVPQNVSQRVARSQKTASFGRNAKDRSFTNRTLGNNQQMIRKNHFSRQRKHQNNDYNEDEDNVTTDGRDNLFALCNEMKLLKSTVSSLVRSLNDKRSVGEEAKFQQNQLFLGLNQCFFQLLSSQNAMTERLNHLEKIVQNKFGTRETATPMEQFHDAGRSDSRSLGVKPLPKSFGQDTPHGWKGCFPLAGRKNSHSSESSKMENESIEQPGFHSLQRSKRRSSGQRQPASHLHSYPNVVSLFKDGSDQEESVPIKTIQASDSGIPDFRTCTVRGITHLKPSQSGTCFMVKCRDHGRAQPNKNNSGLLNMERQCRKNLNTERIWEPQGNNDGDLSISDFTRRVKTPEFVHLKNCFASDVVSSDGASNVPAIHHLSVNSKKGRAGSAPTQRSSDTSYEQSSFNFLQETIYSEVETLVALNERCPHYLIRLFQELQLLSTDFLRQKALLAIQDIVTRGATGEVSEQRNVEADGVSFGCNASAGPGRSDKGGSEKSDLKAEFDYAEGVDSGSSLSTPRSTTEMNNDASLNDTVIHFNNALKQMKTKDDRVDKRDLVVPSEEQFGQSLTLELLHLVDDEDDDDNESDLDNQSPNLHQSLGDAVQVHIQPNISSASEVELLEPTGDKSDEDKVANKDGKMTESRVADRSVEPGSCAKEEESAGGQI